MLDLDKSLVEQTFTRVTWRLTVTNLGPNDTVTPVVVTDPLPAGLTFVAAAGEGWTCAEASGTVRCTYAASLPAGSSASFDLVSEIRVDAPGTIVNTAVVEGGSEETPSVDDSAVVPVPPGPTLPITGAEAAQLLRAVVALVLGGAALAWWGRRRPAAPAAG